jgi:hypothetical protein
VVRTGPNRDDFCQLITTATGLNDRLPDKTNFQLQIVQGKDISIKTIRYSLINGPPNPLHATLLGALHLLSELQAMSGRNGCSGPGEQNQHLVISLV